MRALPNDCDADPGRFLAAGKHPHDDVHPYVAARFAGKIEAKRGCIVYATKGA
jgi:hypothetical protein